MTAESAFIVRVAEAEPLVGRLRLRYDPSAALRVPAHITVLYPFMAPEKVTTSVVVRVMRTLSSFPTFKFSLVSISRSPDVAYLVPHPSEPFVAMTQALAGEFPEFPLYSGRQRDIIPHRSVATGSTEVVEPAAAELAPAFEQSGPIHSTCRAVEWIENSTGFWEVMRVIPLQELGA